MNLFEGRISNSSDSLRIGSQQIKLPPSVFERHPDLKSFVDRTVVVGIRPEDLPASGDDYQGDLLWADVHLVEALGSELLVHFRIDVEPILVGDSLIVDGTSMVEEGSGGRGDFIARVSPRKKVVAGDRVSLAVAPTRIEFFELETGDAIRK